MTPATDRILGWDALRGICAIGVATYHLAYWLGLGELSALGTYGVYIFFALSGASLAYNYPAQRLGGLGDAGRFLATRWLRLAPLHLVVCVLFLVMLALHRGEWTDRIPLRLALNASFAFGLHDATVWALAIGGWSLGIEFVFYLAFPLFARLVAWRGLAWAFLLAMLGLQLAWIERTVGQLGWEEGVTAYHQPQAFIAYFFGGCMLGAASRGRAAGHRARGAVLATVALFGALLIVSRRPAGEELTGATGLLLCAGCLLLVAWWSSVRLRDRAARWAVRLGDATYGTYLLHPMLYFTLAWFVAPAIGLPEPSSWSVPVRLSTLMAVLLTAVLLGIASERCFEQPVRRWGQRRLRRTYNDAASISS